MTIHSKTNSEGQHPFREHDEAVSRTHDSELDARSAAELVEMVRRLEIERLELERQNERLRHSEQALLRRLEFEKFLFDLSRTFIGLTEEEVDQNMERGLARVGKFLAMDRVTLLELSDDRKEMAVAYSWSGRGATISPPVITKGAQPWWVGQVLRGEASLASHVDDLPEEAAAEKEYLRQRGVASAASIPLKVSGEIAGAISFVTMQRHVEWTEELVNELRALGDILWNALKRRQAMQALRAAQGFLRESEERFRLAMNNVAAGVYTLDLDGAVTYVNPAAESIFGWTNAELVGRKMHDVTHYKHPDGTPYPASECPGLQIVQTGIELRECEDTFIRKDGSFVPVVFSASPLKKEGMTVGIVVGFRDDTLRRDAAQALSTVSQRLIQAHEEERTRLARELHDDILQRLSILSVNLQRVKRRPAALVAEVDQELGNAIQRVGDLATDLQTLSHRLHSSKLALVGLAGAAAGFCEELSDREGVEIDYHAENISKTLPMEISLCLFRVLQESLQNAIKHSGSRSLQVLLRGQADVVILTVKDSGVGFDLQEAMKGRGLGLTSMKERLALVHGQLSVHSELGRGTTIQARVPLEFGADVAGPNRSGDRA